MHTIVQLKNPEAQNEEDLDREDKPNMRYYTFVLNDTNKREEFNITLSNKFQALQELMEEETVDIRW